MKAKPVCAVCGVPVETFDEVRDDHLERVTFTARCHGQSERVTVDREVLQVARGVDFGKAFASGTRRLEAP